MRALLSTSLSCALCILAAACATPATRPMIFAAQGGEAATEAAAGECVVYVRRIEDQREGSPGFGSSANFEQFALHLADWVKSAVRTLESPKRKVIMPTAGTAGSASQDGLTMTVRIHKAYIHNLATSKTAHIVLSNQYEHGGRVVGTEYYRGSDTSVNWSNSADEVESAMNTAMNSALVAMRKDIDRYCRNTLIQQSAGAR
jgi:hypothetical protein